MAVANAWGVGQSIPLPQFKPFCCIRKSTNPNCFVLGFGNNAASLSSARILKTSSGFLCRCVNTNTSSDSNSSGSISASSSSSSSSSGWDWNRWTRHFSEIEQAESFLSVLKFQLGDAIEREDFQEAAKLKLVISEFTSKDSVAAIMSELKIAINEERYHDASRLCKDTASGLVGWWVGYSNDSGDPFGRLVRITPSVGRFVGRSFSPRQLVTASPGTPLFEIFVVKEADGTYTLQVVYLQRAKVNSPNIPNLLSRPRKISSTPEVKNASVEDVQGSEGKADKNEDKGIDIEEATEEGIKSVINFLKDKIPGLKVKVMDVETPAVMEEDNESAEPVMQNDDEKMDPSENSEDEAGDLNDIQPDGIVLKGGSGGKDEDTSDAKLVIGGVVHNEDTPTKDDYVRLSAEIKDMERDSFVLHVPRRSLDSEVRESKSAKVKVAAIAAQDMAKLMPSEVAKAFWSSDKISSKVSKDVREIVKLAVSQAQKRNRLSEFTTFNRITTSTDNLDPFEGLYVGAFGPYGTEVVQLRRKYGQWTTDNQSSDVEFFEYVEAVKLTGDLNVPAGKVTFRAKIGKGSRLTNRGMFPDELGVVASYKGQGRIAEYGFKNPQWVDGELLQFSGKGMGPYVKGADLGFLYVVPEQSFLVLFNRLKLPE